jgi:hypothetical protein
MKAEQVIQDQYVTPFKLPAEHNQQQTSAASIHTKTISTGKSLEESSSLQWVETEQVFNRMPVGTKLLELTSAALAKHSSHDFTDDSFVGILYTFQKIQHSAQKLSSFLAFYSPRMELVGLLQDSCDKA